jgi:sulfofructose kinase
MCSHSGTGAKVVRATENPPGGIAVLAIGHAAYDLCMVVDGYPPENSKAQTEMLIESGGGPAANAAWLLARWGVPVALAGVIGDDDYGHRVAMDLRQGGVDCRLLEMRKGQTTPVSFIMVNRSNASRTIINRKATAPALTLDHSKLAGLEPRLLLFDGHEATASLQAMKAFSSATTVLDAGSLREGTQVLAPRVHYLACSERFATQFTGVSDIQGNWKTCLRRLRELNGNVVVVTLGERGVLFDDGRQQGHLAALSVKAVDTTAAGDIFHGAFAFALLRGVDLGGALRLAMVAAGLSVQRFGGRPSVPELAAALDLANKANVDLRHHD